MQDGWYQIVDDFGGTYWVNEKVIWRPVRIANVSFYVDGKLLGTATASPYTLAWNTAGTRRGQHTLTAIARDKAGNTTTSAPVVVSVN